MPNSHMRRASIPILMSGGIPILFQDSFGAALSASWTNLVGTFETNAGKARGATIAVDGNNLAANVEFTTNLTGWTNGNVAYGFERVDCTTSPDIDPTGGTDEFAAKHTSPNAFGAFAYQEFANHLLGATYTCSCRGYYPSSNTGGGVSRLRIADSAGVTTVIGTVADTWQTLTGTRKIITGTLTDVLRIGVSAGTNDVAYIDKVVANAQVALATFDVANASLDITCTVTMPASGTTPFGFVLRLTDAANYWLVRIIPGTAGTDFQLLEVNTGVITSRAAADIDWVAGQSYIINMRCYSNKYSVKVDTVEKLSYTDAGSFNITATDFGLYDMGATNGLFDDLEVRPCSPFDIAAFSRVSEAVLWSASGAHDWLGRPLLADDGTNFICIYRSAPGHGDDATSLVHIRFSDDEGVSWSDEDKTIAGAAVTGFPIGIVTGAADVSPYDLLIAPNGDLLAWIYHATGANGGTYQYRSTDDGATWSSDGRVPIDANTMIGGLDHCIVGTDIYMVANYDAGGDQTHPWTVRCYKSTDSGATWSALTDVDAVTDGNEAGIGIFGSTRLVVLVRDSDDITTYLYTSENLGTAWSPRGNIGATQTAVFHRPMIKEYSGKLISFGRDYVLGAEHTVVYYSHDGVFWQGKFYPDADAYVDTGYCSLVQRANGDFYMLSYAGTFAVASVVEYVFRLS